MWVADDRTGPVAAVRPACHGRARQNGFRMPRDWNIFALLLALAI